MKVREVASSAVVTVGPMQTLREAARLMATHRVGSAVVQDAEHLAGILTERDVLKAVAAGAEPAGVMARRRIRHLVVYDGGQLLGVLSVRDVLPALLPAKQPSR